MSFETRLADAVQDAARREFGVELDGAHVERPNDPSHGDFATNVALANARVFRRNPREVAEGIAAAIDAPFVDEAEVAGPGFLNFRLSPEALWGEVGELLGSADGYGRKETSGGPIQLEFVSANPTGPMLVSHGRHAAYGDSLARILEAAGRKVFREFYFNDGGNQIRLFGESVAVRYAALLGEEWPVEDPESLYKGSYTEEIARDLADERGDGLLELGRDEALREIGDFATGWCMRDIKRTLVRFRVSFDEFFNEKSLYDSGAVDEVVRRLDEGGNVYESDGRAVAGVFEVRGRQGQGPRKERRNLHLRRAGHRLPREQARSGFRDRGQRARRRPRRLRPPHQGGVWWRSGCRGSSWTSRSCAWSSSCARASR